MVRLVSPLLLALLVVGCDDTRPPTDAGADAGPGDAGADAGAEDGGPASCEELLDERRTAYDRGTVRTQIHPVARWDGEAIWVVYVKPDADGLFDVYATRLGCDGAPLIEPFSVSSDPGFGNDIDPELVLDGERMLIAWNTDDGTGGTDNLSVRYRLFALDGTPMGDDQTLVTTHEGAPVMANQLGVKLATRPGGGFVVAGARGVPDAVPAFSAYAQALDASGAPDGATIAPLLEADAGQTGTAVGVASDGTVWLAYTRSTTDPDTEHVRIFREGAGAPEPALEGLTSTAGPSVLALGDAVWVAMSGLEGGETDLRIVDVTEPLASRQAAVVGEPRRVEFSPRLAAADDGTFAVVWFRQTVGFAGEVYAARVVPGSPPSVAAPVRIDARGAPAYQPAITHVMGDWWFLSFAEGDSPDFRLVGRFVALPAP